MSSTVYEIPRESPKPPATAATGAAEDLILTPMGAEGEGTVGLFEVIRMSFDSLWANKMRSLLTMLGVIIGVGSVVALLSLGAGASATITNQVRGIGTNLLTVIPGSPRGQQGGPGSVAQTLTLADAEAIMALNLPVNGVAPQFTSNTPVVAPAASKSASVVGTTAVYQTLNNMALASGVFLNEGQVRGASPVIVLGSTLAKDLFGNGQAVGQSVRVKDQVLVVIGVLEAKGGGSFGSVDNQAFVPITLAQQRLFGARTPDGNNYIVSSIAVGATNSEDIPGIQSRIRLLLRDRHHLKTDGSEDDFILFDQASILGTLTTITTTLTIFLAAIAGISLVVGGIGIMNIMLVSVTERTKEIGLRKAVGARGQDILLQFVIEALGISVLGGLLGLALGAGIATAVTLSGLLTAPVTLSAVVVALSFSMAVGLFFGIYPARRAAQLNPIDALRYE